MIDELRSDLDKKFDELKDRQDSLEDQVKSLEKKGSGKGGSSSLHTGSMHCFIILVPLLIMHGWV